jgi:hypothetical protein
VRRASGVDAGGDRHRARQERFYDHQSWRGIDYSLGHSVMALARGTFGARRFSLDKSWNVFSQWTTSTDLLVILCVEAGALVQLMAL